MTATKRRRLKRIAADAAAEICSAPKEERQAVQLYFNGELNDWIEDHETREQINAMINEGGPDIREDD